MQSQLAPQRHVRHSWNILHCITKVIVVQSNKKTMKQINTSAHVSLKKQSSGCFWTNYLISLIFDFNFCKFV